ncbi:hypothetical protein V6N13_048595 [Hibiscus sabdariffa]|uniref:Uncharacterized protein n=1 Tax=Hibiscus sabdariffa TaxID=183260 RepID=A0ABR2F7Q0_9ROSI
MRDDAVQRRLGLRKLSTFMVVPNLGTPLAKVSFLLAFQFPTKTTAGFSSLVSSISRLPPGKPSLHSFPSIQGGSTSPPSRPFLFLHSCSSRESSRCISV